MTALKPPLLSIMKDIVNLLRYGWRLRRVWMFTASARTSARFARTIIGGFWLGISNLFSIAVLAIVYGTVFRVSDFRSYVVYLGLGLVIWNSMAAAITSAPSLASFAKSARFPVLGTADSVPSWHPLSGPVPADPNRSATDFLAVPHPLQKGESRCACLGG
jgi:hypothetical protein